LKYVRLSRIRLSESILHYILGSFEWYFHIKLMLCMSKKITALVGKKNKKTSPMNWSFLRKLGEVSNIQVSHTACMGLNKAFARVNGITHEHVEGPIRFGGILHSDHQQGTIFWVHSRFP
jgi:hypothetical protein